MLIIINRVLCVKIVLSIEFNVVRKKIKVFIFFYRVYSFVIELILDMLIFK